MSDKNIDKHINRCKELIKEEHSNWIGLTNQEAIENVLSELEKKELEIKRLREDYLLLQKSSEEYEDKLEAELETYKKIVKLLADTMAKEHTNTPYEFEKARVSIIDWAKNEVLKNE